MTIADLLIALYHTVIGKMLIIGILFFWTLIILIFYRLANLLFSANKYVHYRLIIEKRRAKKEFGYE